VVKITKRRVTIMLKEMGFYKGINLGGWLSQCDYSEEHMDSFISEKDYAVIAGWGADHVRIPFDYNIIENADGTFNDNGFARIDKAIALSRKNGLNIVLDLHKTAGFSFDYYSENENGFFENPFLQERFYRLWEEVARRYGNDPEHIAFELLNEVTDMEFMEMWNRIVRVCISRIRAIASETLIFVGSCHNNSADTVYLLEEPFDSRVVYNMHCYEPLKFTHQGAYWTDAIVKSDRFTADESGVTPELFEELFSTAIEKARDNGVELYCGEYGVIDVVSPEETLKWYRSINTVFEKYGISRCAWSYRKMDFGLSDSRLDSIRPELLKVI